MNKCSDISYTNVLVSMQRKLEKKDTLGKTRDVYFIFRIFHPIYSVLSSLFYVNHVGIGGDFVLF